VKSERFKKWIEPICYMEYVVYKPKLILILKTNNKMRIIEPLLRIPAAIAYFLFCLFWLIGGISQLVEGNILSGLFALGICYLLVYYVLTFKHPDYYDNKISNKKSKSEKINEEGEITEIDYGDPEKLDEERMDSSLSIKLEEGLIEYLGFMKYPNVDDPRVPQTGPKLDDKYQVPFQKDNLIFKDYRTALKKRSKFRHSSHKGIHITVYVDRLGNYYGVDKGYIVSLLPDVIEKVETKDLSDKEVLAYRCEFTTMRHVKNLIEGLRALN